MFSQASVILLTGGGVHGFIRGAWFYSGGHAWFYSGGIRGFIRGVHAWFYSGGMHGFIGGHAWFYSGVCVVLSGGMHGFIRGACVVLSGGVCVVSSGVGGCVRGFSSFFGYNEIRSMSGRYASYWNAFLFHSALNMSNKAVWTP